MVTGTVCPTGFRPRSGDIEGIRNGNSPRVSRAVGCEVVYHFVPKDYLDNHAPQEFQRVDNRIFEE